MKLTDEWKTFLIDYLKTQGARDLQTRVLNEYAKCKVCPPKDKVFSALNTVSPQDVRVVILGQDPYFNEGQATGMSFSINPDCGCKFPPSLSNIIKEITDEYGTCAVANGDLTPWAKQGVLLLNTSLTVRQGSPLSHADIGWNEFTRAVIARLNERGVIVFVLWGSHANKYREIITNKSNLILHSAHPSPLSAHNGFFGNGHFKAVNHFLKSNNCTEIVW
jgi:uracil-DNA glycosylase